VRSDHFKGVKIAVDSLAKRKTLAERYFRAVYSGDVAVVNELVSENITCTYPIFQEIFDQPAIRGREEVANFANRFSHRWTDVDISFHQIIAEGQQVVLLWSVRAQTAAAKDEGSALAVHGWGGITLIQFDAQDKIVAEIGEESTPGPHGRLGRVEISSSG
jgi:ketosteroid isomerase-like protein